MNRKWAGPFVCSRRVDLALAATQGRPNPVSVTLALFLAAFDWYGAIDRVDHYSALLVDAPSEEIERCLLRSARLDPRITPAQWHWLRGIALANPHDGAQPG